MHQRITFVHKQAMRNRVIDYLANCPSNGFFGNR